MTVSEIIMCILTAVYVVTTILILCSNNKIQKQNASIQLFDKRQEVYYILWRWCDISKKAFDNLESPIVAFQEQLSYYRCNCEIFHIGNIIGSAKFLYRPLECGKAEEFRTAFVDMAYEPTVENLQKLKASFQELEKTNLLVEMKKHLDI
jgi:hypothetical protein